MKKKIALFMSALFLTLQIFAQSVLITPYKSAQVYDSDAKKFIAITGITDSVNIFALNRLCLNLKNWYIWDSLDLIAPMAGNTSTTHAYNLKDSEADLVFHGGLVHDSLGVHGNEVDGYIDLGFKPSDFPQNNFNMSVYNSKGGFLANMLIGVASPRIEMFANGDMYYSVNEGTEPHVSIVAPKAFYSVSRYSSDSTAIYIDGSKAGSGSNASSAPNSTLNIFALARNMGAIIDNYSNGVLSFITLGKSLAESTQRNLFIAIQQYQIDLGRNN